MSELPQSELRDIGELSFGRRQPIDLENVPLALTAQRQQVSGQEIEHTPWRKICDLLITANDGTLHTGTAWFISPRTLVTAGHCLFVHNPGTAMHGMVREILVMPARNGETNAAQSPFGWVEVPRNHLQVHPNWKDGNINFDYGVIILPDGSPPIGAVTGGFGFAHFEDEDLDESTPTLSGYPDNAPEDGTQWFEMNRIKQLNSRRVFYLIQTADGQSGSPVFFSGEDGDIACAIHNWGDISFNSGVRINQEVIDQLNDWRVD